MMDIRTYDDCVEWTGEEHAMSPEDEAWLKIECEIWMERQVRFYTQHGFFTFTPKLQILNCLSPPKTLEASTPPAEGERS